MSALRSVAHEFTHVNERPRYRVIIPLRVGCSKLSWFGRGFWRILRPRGQAAAALPTNVMMKSRRFTNQCLPRFRPRG